jgi:putative chitinase
MNLLTVEQFARCTGASLVRASPRHMPYMKSMQCYAIDTALRQAMFLVNVGHECGGFRFPQELWGPTEAQRRYERDFSCPWPSNPAESKLDEFEANRLAYSLGNVNAGDGARFKGHGDLQITGRGNHAGARDRLRKRWPQLGVPDFEAEPEQLCEPQWAALAACDYVDMKNANEQADLGNFDHYCDLVNRGRCTVAVGDANGYRDRLLRLQEAYAALGLQ